MTIPIELIIAGITIISAVLGWAINKLVGVGKELIDAVTQLRIIMSAVQEDNKNINSNCKNRSYVVDNRLNTHSSKIEAHGLLLAEHEIQIKELQKKEK
jgi:hypothetical protein